MSDHASTRRLAEYLIDTVLWIFVFFSWWWPTVSFPIHKTGRGRAYGELSFSIIGIATLAALVELAIQALFGMLQNLWVIPAIGGAYVLEFTLYLMWEQWERVRVSIARDDP